MIKCKSSKFGSKFHRFLINLQEVRHENLNTFYGLVESPANTMALEANLIWAFCARGSLVDVLNDKNIRMDWSFYLSLILDLARVSVLVADLCSFIFSFIPFFLPFLVPAIAPFNANWQKAYSTAIVIFANVILFIPNLFSNSPVLKALQIEQLRVANVLSPHSLLLTLNS